MIEIFCCLFKGYSNTIFRQSIFIIFHSNFISNKSSHLIKICFNSIKSFPDFTDITHDGIIYIINLFIDFIFPFVQRILQVFKFLEKFRVSGSFFIIQFTQILINNDNGFIVCNSVPKKFSYSIHINIFFIHRFQHIEKRPHILIIYFFQSVSILKSHLIYSFIF